MQWASGSHSNSSVNSSAIVALYLELTSPSNPYIWFIVMLSWLPSVCGKGGRGGRKGGGGENINENYRIKFNRISHKEPRRPGLETNPDEQSYLKSNPWPLSYMALSILYRRSVRSMLTSIMVLYSYRYLPDDPLPNQFWGIVDDIIPILPPNVYTSRIRIQTDNMLATYVPLDM